MDLKIYSGAGASTGCGAGNDPPACPAGWTQAGCSDVYAGPGSGVTTFNDVRTCFKCQ